MKYYRKQPVEAIQWNGDNQKELSGFIDKVAKDYCTKDDGYGNLNVCYMDSKKRMHQAVIPKFGWVVIEGKTLQFYKDETFKKTFKPADGNEDMTYSKWAVDYFLTPFIPVRMDFADYIKKESHENKAPKDDDKSEPSILDLARQTVEDVHKNLMEVLDKKFEDNYQAMLDKWLETLVSDASKLWKYTVDEKDADITTFDSVLDEMKELHAKKNKDYKVSFHDLFKEYGMPYALGHLEEKLNRVKAITENGGNAVKNEHIEDSVIDLASYAVMLYVELKNQKK